MKLSKSFLGKTLAFVLALSFLGSVASADSLSLCSRGSMKVKFVNQTAGVLISSAQVKIIGYAISTSAAAGDRLVILGTNVVQAPPAVGAAAFALMMAPPLVSTQVAGVIPSASLVQFFPQGLESGVLQTTRAALSTPNGVVAAVSAATTPGWVYFCD